MSQAAEPDDNLRQTADAQVVALMALRDELRALNARLEYYALMLRLTRPPSAG